MTRRTLLLGLAATTVIPLASAAVAQAPRARADSEEARFRQRQVTTARHRTAYIEAGPIDGPLMIFVHGWPELGIVWREQIEYFAVAGWRCVAPDMRGYGRSSVPKPASAYAMREIVADMAELQDALGGTPAVWVGHDWGSPVVWQLAATEAARCRAIVSLNVPYLPSGFGLAAVVPLVDRKLYPAARYPLGQWDYMQFYNESPEVAVRDFEADVPAWLATLYSRGSPAAVGKPAATASIRANGGWFGAAHRPPKASRDPAILPEATYATLVDAFERNGFAGPNNWYRNEASNVAYAKEAPSGGRLALPVLFLHARFDQVVDSANSRLAEPMRAACADLTESFLDAGHWLAQERPREVNLAIARWLGAKRLSSASLIR